MRCRNSGSLLVNNHVGSFEYEPLLEGIALRVRPIRIDDLEALYSVASDPLLWEQHPAKQRSQRPVFEKWFADGLAQHALVVEEKATGRIIGSSRYYNWDERAHEVSVGFTFIARDHWGGATNAELKRLMLDHAFRWANTVWFHVDPANTRSRKAMEKIGGRNSHTAMISIHGSPAAEHVFYRIEAPVGRSGPRKAQP